MNTPPARTQATFMKCYHLITLGLALPLAGLAQTTFFSDSFSAGSTLNQAAATPTPTSTSYQTAVGLAGATTNFSPGHLTLNFPSTSSVLGEVMGLFTNSPLTLAVVGDHLDLTVVFVNTNILSGTDGSSASLNIGLFNSGGVAPNQGNIVLNTGNITGGSQNWLGYASRIIFSGSSSIFTRPAQTASGTSSQNQDVLFSNASGSQAFNNPAGTSLGSTASTISLTTGFTNTLQFIITLTAANTYSISNILYAGAGTGGTVLFTQTKNASGANYLTGGFNALAVGWRNSSSPAQVSTMDIASITVAGQATQITAPPSIDTQPIAVTVATGGAAAFQVAATGFSVTYQWHRNGTNLLNAGNISGATSSTLVISQASSADVASGANGYYVTVSGAGGYFTNSVTNSLALVTAKNLVWSGSGTDWDLNNTANWLNGASPATFNYGDAVTFDDTGLNNNTVNLVGNFLSASTVTVNSSSGYTFSGTGSFAGPGTLLYKGSGMLFLNNVNTHTGGTIISNASAYVYLQNLAGLGNGPVTLALAGGLLRVLPAGSASSGINGDIRIADDFTIQLDGTGSYAGVFNGNLSGTAGKTLTINPLNPTTTTNRIRLLGSATTNNANLAINVNGNPTAGGAVYDGTVIAPYHGSGVQVYNGVISGYVGLIQRAAGTTILNGANTYSGYTVPSTGSIGLGIDTVGNVTSGPIGTGPLLMAPEFPNTTGSGMIYAYGGARTIANLIQYQSGTNNQTLIIGGTNNLTLSGAVTLQGNDGLTSASFTARTIQVTNTGATTISGVISDGGMAYGLIKTGPGTLYLNAANTYTGPTTNSAGVLAGTGSLHASSSVYVQTNAAIGGGTAAALGTLTINGNLTLGALGGGFFRLNKSGSPTSDKVSVTGTLTSAGTGTITLTNLGAALTAGDKFTLFNKAMTGGSSLVVTGALSAGFVWSNSLAVDGSVQVVQSFATYSTNITATVNGTTLNITWPATHLGWNLQSQTNTLGTGLGTNWVTIPGSSGVITTNLTINPANPTVFYRLSKP